MTDIKIQSNGLEVRNGDFANVSGVEEIKQHITVALNTFKGDWILNRDKGINYSHGFRNMSFLENAVKNQLNNIDNVISTENFEMTFDKNSLAIKISAIVNTTFGKIYIDEAIYNQ